MKEVLHSFCNKREVSIHEAIYRVTSQWLFHKSRSVVYVSNAPEEEHHRMPKHQGDLLQMKDEDENVFQVSICHQLLLLVHSTPHWLAGRACRFHLQGGDSSCSWVVVRTLGHN